jgi:hypothetical protein
MLFSVPSIRNAEARGAFGSLHSEQQEYTAGKHIVTEIKVRRLEWLGHVIRMEDIRLPKMVFNAKPEGRRGVGRPRLRWLDDVEADIKKPWV